MLINLRPLRYREYRLLLIGQTVSFLGSMITYVALPWQVYELTHSTFLVGLLGAVELVPILIFALIGGSVADSFDRRRLLIGSEALLSLGTIALSVNAATSRPSVVAIFVIAAVMQSLNGFHRPAMDAMVQKLVPPEDYSSVGAIGNLRSSVGAILGPALGGVIISVGGVKSAYLFDFATFLIALVAVFLMKPIPFVRNTTSHSAKIKEGLKYAISRPELIGTYIVDIVAMTFAFPIALFPALGEQWGGPKTAGLLFSSMAVGSLTVTLLSGWTTKVRRYGAFVVLAAAFWGVAIVGAGFATKLPILFLCLALAGAADTVSGIFRQVIWNETIPNEMRGRLSGIEMISYMTGPLVGNTRAGWVASFSSVRTSIVSGGVLCVAGVAACGFLLPQFWNYRSTAASKK